MLLTKVAADVLRRPDAPTAEVGVAVVALAEAARQGLEVPLDVPTLLWGAVVRSPTATWASEATEAVGLLADRSLVQEIVGAITRPEAGREVRRMGLAVLADPKAGAHLLDSELLALVEVARWRENHEVANIIRGVAEGRRIDPTILGVIVGRWSTQADDPLARTAALDIVDLLPRAEGAAVVERLLLDDPSPKVREAVRVLRDVLDEQAALGLIERALQREEHGEVRVALERARVEALAKER